MDDFAGRRTSINRDGKVWNYTYDKNGNMLAEQVPYPSGALAADYTNLQTYDALDRVAAKTIGQRNLSTADQALFGKRAYTFMWDVGGNRTGRLKDVSAYAPSSSTYSVALQYNYDALGNRVNTIEGLRVAGFPLMQRSFFQTYTPHFGPRLTKFNDGFSTGLTSTQTYYDGRGMPKRIDLIRTGNTTQQMAVQTRNVAGLVTKRRTDQLAATGTMPWVESNWVYDSLGRPLSQTVQNGAGASTVQVAKQQLAYYGTGDVKQLIHTLGASNTTTFNFEFDARHQLTRVKAGTAFDSTYTFGDPALAAVTPGNSGRFTKVHIAANTALPGSDVKPREVNYVYGTGGAAGVDKEAVTTLTNVAGGATFASYEYDSAGNQTSRTYTAGNERWDYVYDGEDNLRRVTKKVAGVVSGSEEYWYDESGGRMAIVYRNELGKKTGLRWFIGGTEAYYTASGVGENTATLSKVYSHPSLGTPVARVERTSDAVTKVEYQFHGLASNTLAAVASDGTVNTSFVYAPYGEVVEATDGGGGVGAGKNAHRRRITDKYVDEIGGLTYFGARYYDGVMLGWTQGDPLFRFQPDRAWVEPRKGNLYQYVLANPVRYTDPDGRAPRREDVINIVNTTRPWSEAHQAQTVERVRSEMQNARGPDVKVTVTVSNGKLPEGAVKGSPGVHTIYVIGSSDAAEAAEILKSSNPAAPDRTIAVGKKSIEEGGGANIELPAGGSVGFVPNMETYSPPVPGEDAESSADGAPQGNMILHEVSHGHGNKEHTDNSIMSKPVPKGSSATFTKKEKQTIRKSTTRPLAKPQH